MSVAEKLLLLVSRKPGGDDYPEGKAEWTLDDALSILCRVFPNFLDDIRGMDILDYGCGEGYQTAALANNGARYVLGIDPDGRALEAARRLAQETNLQQRVEFAERFNSAWRGRFDLVLSQNGMEHYPHPAGALEEMKSALKPTGRIFITFGPPWFAPYGSHMHFFTKMPWINLLFPERAVMKVRNNFRQDGATQYEEVESGLNRMSVAKFEAILSSADMNVVYRRYDCVKDMRLLGRLPAMRELVINHISCVLTRA